MRTDSFRTRAELRVEDATYRIHRLAAIGAAERLPYSLKVLLENLLRNEDGQRVTAEQIEALAGWRPHDTESREIHFTPARVLMQDFTGVPCVVDLVAMRDAIIRLGGNTKRVNPLVPTELVIDHSVIADVFGRVQLDHGHVVIAAITSCTNTSNPSVMIGAALLAARAVERGLNRKPWVKTSLAPGSRVVTDYLERAGLTPYLDRLGFNLVGYGCTTCIGNSGPLIPEVAAAVAGHDLTVCSVLSGNRTFEGRIHAQCRMNFLASPLLVVAYALAGTLRIDLLHEPLGTDTHGNPVYLHEIWPTSQEIQTVIDSCVRAEMFAKDYADVFSGDDRWRSLRVPQGEAFEWDTDSTYVRRPPYFDGVGREPAPLSDISGARVLAMLGDSVTTDHISPAGTIAADSPAGAYLTGRGIARKDFNSYGSRRGNHEVMIRGTFANIRLRNLLVPGTDGGFTRDFTQPGGPVTTIYDASSRYLKAGTALLILAGKEYGSGSSRDWAAKGTALLGVRAVIAESYERIHRSNLIGMGVLPLQFRPGQSAASLGLSGEEIFEITGLAGAEIPRTMRVNASGPDGRIRDFDAIVRIDTPLEASYYRHGGILPYMLRQLAAGPPPA